MLISLLAILYTCMPAVLDLMLLCPYISVRLHHFTPPLVWAVVNVRRLYTCPATRSSHCLNLLLCVHTIVNSTGSC